MSVGGVVIYNNLADSQPTPSNGVVGKISDDWDTGIEEETSPEKTGIQISGYSTAEMKSESCTSTERVPVFLVIISAVDSKLSVDAALVSSFIFQRCDEIPSAFA